MASEIKIPKGPKGQSHRFNILGIRQALGVANHRGCGGGLPGGARGPWMTVGGSSQSLRENVQQFFYVISIKGMSQWEAAAPGDGEKEETLNRGKE